VALGPSRGRDEGHRSLAALGPGVEHGEAEKGGGGVLPQGRGRARDKFMGWLGMGVYGNGQRQPTDGDGVCPGGFRAIPPPPPPPRFSSFRKLTIGGGGEGGKAIPIWYPQTR